MAKKKTPKRSSKAARKSSKASARSTKSSKKTVAKKSAPKKIAKKSAARRAALPEILSSEERSKLLKPRTDFLEVLEKVAREWRVYRDLRVPGLSVAKLASLGSKAARAEQRESDALEGMRRKVVPLSDARRIAHDAAYRALLDTHAAVKLQARVDPSVVERFAFLAELVRNEAAPSSDDDEPDVVEDAGDPTVTTP